MVTALVFLAAAAVTCSEPSRLFQGGETARFKVSATPTGTLRVRDLSEDEDLETVIRADFADSSGVGD